MSFSNSSSDVTSYLDHPDEECTRYYIGLFSDVDIYVSLTLYNSILLSDDVAWDAPSDDSYGWPSLARAFRVFRCNPSVDLVYTLDAPADIPASFFTTYFSTAAGNPDASFYEDKLQGPGIKHMSLDQGAPGWVFLQIEVDESALASFPDFTFTLASEIVEMNAEEVTGAELCSVEGCYLTRAVRMSSLDTSLGAAIYAWPSDMSTFMLSPQIGASFSHPALSAFCEEGEVVSGVGVATVGLDFYQDEQLLYVTLLPQAQTPFWDEGEETTSLFRFALSQLAQELLPNEAPTAFELTGSGAENALFYGTNFGAHVGDLPVYSGSAERSPLVGFKASVSELSGTSFSITVSSSEVQPLSNYDFSASGDTAGTYEILISPNSDGYESLSTYFVALSLAEATSTSGAYSLGEVAAGTLWSLVANSALEFSADAREDVPIYFVIEEPEAEALYLYLLSAAGSVSSRVLLSQSTMFPTDSEADWAYDWAKAQQIVLNAENGFDPDIPVFITCYVRSGRFSFVYETFGNAHMRDGKSCSFQINAGSKEAPARLDFEFRPNDSPVVGMTPQNIAFELGLGDDAEQSPAELTVCVASQDSLDEIPDDCAGATARTISLSSGVSDYIALETSGNSGEKFLAAVFNAETDPVIFNALFVSFEELMGDETHYMYPPKTEYATYASFVAQGAQDINAVLEIAPESNTTDAASIVMSVCFEQFPYSASDASAACMETSVDAFEGGAREVHLFSDDYNFLEQATFFAGFFPSGILADEPWAVTFFPSERIRLNSYSVVDVGDSGATRFLSFSTDSFEFSSAYVVIRTTLLDGSMSGQACLSATEFRPDFSQDDGCELFGLGGDHIVPISGTDGAPTLYYLSFSSSSSGLSFILEPFLSLELAVEQPVEFTLDPRAPLYFQASLADYAKYTRFSVAVQPFQTEPEEVPDNFNTEVMTLFVSYESVTPSSADNSGESYPGGIAYVDAGSLQDSDAAIYMSLVPSSSLTEPLPCTLQVTHDQYARDVTDGTVSIKINSEADSTSYFAAYIARPSQITVAPCKGYPLVYLDPMNTHPDISDPNSRVIEEGWGVEVDAVLTEDTLLDVSYFMGVSDNPSDPSNGSSFSFTLFQFAIGQDPRPASTNYNITFVEITAQNVSVCVTPMFFADASEHQSSDISYALYLMPVPNEKNIFTDFVPTQSCGMIAGGYSGMEDASENAWFSAADLSDETGALAFTSNKLFTQGVEYYLTVVAKGPDALYSQYSTRTLVWGDAPSDGLPMDPNVPDVPDESGLSWWEILLICLGGACLLLALAYLSVLLIRRLQERGYSLMD
eukprot:gnl/Chilomastix_cuspidata/1270.p1 GENE.gnl/Chilomastix_cuspidata/1270~~gnl/Chilomastix_cuspidata/1270.p1  ORF type:complete len:1408 (-),score=296.19 gnl/Chilomastix_cuspidata/1270:3421-7365(-)